MSDLMIDCQQILSRLPVPSLLWEVPPVAFSVNRPLAVADINMEVPAVSSFQVVVFRQQEIDGRLRWVSDRPVTARIIL